MCVKGLSREETCDSCRKSIVSAEPERQLLRGIERATSWEKSDLTIDLAQLCDLGEVIWGLSFFTYE